MYSQYSCVIIVHQMLKNILVPLLTTLINTFFTVRVSAEKGKTYYHL